MIKIVVTFGIIAGLICGGMFFLQKPEDGLMDFSNGALYGYVTMIIALSTIFFAVKQYRDKYNGGVIKFGKAFVIGLFITLIAGIVYVIAWEIFFTNYVPDYGEQYLTYLEQEMGKDGLSTTEIDTQLAPQREMMLAYQENILMRLGFTFLEIFPVGLVISLISALVFGIFF